MNPFVLPISSLMQHWKDLRNNLKNLDEQAQLKAVVEFWSFAPLKSYAHDPEALDTYGSPWEMMHENDWCQNSIAVGMEFTLRLGGWEPERLKIAYVRDHDVSIMQLVVIVDDTYWLNYDYREVSLQPNTKYDILDTWQYIGKGYKRI